MKKFLLYYNTIKYLKPVQIYGRLFSLLKKKLISGRITLKQTPKYTPLKTKTDFLYHDPWNNTYEILRGNFTFLNDTVTLGFPPKWKEVKTSLLWQFNLHYFNYLKLLIYAEQVQICRDWITNNAVGQGVGWHPYVISLRIINWCKIGFRDQKINKSIYQQAAYLYRNLEYYHPANHYLENARALIFAGLYFKEQGESTKWLKRGLQIYLKQTPKQVLDDGGYFERSMMYHAIMLEGFLDIINIVPVENYSYGFLKNIASEMLDFLIATTHPDGNISLFNDSTQEIAPSTSELKNYAKRLSISSTHFSSLKDVKRSYIYSFEDSGYYVYKDDKIYLIVDAGAVGPDNIPAHAHADIFSYELSFEGILFVVDSGVYEYKSGEMRNYVRSTKAHNTVSIDEKDQAEKWGSFRVARRYKPYDVVFREIVGKTFFEGKFDGYSKIIGDNLIHQRKIMLDKDSSQITFEDTITGSRNHLVESFIHLHPDVKVKEEEGQISLTSSNVSIKLLIPNSEYAIEEGWYCPEFGKKINNKIIVLSSNQLPIKINYSFII